MKSYLNGKDLKDIDYYLFEQQGIILQSQNNKNRVIELRKKIARTLSNIKIEVKGEK